MKKEPNSIYFTAVDDVEFLATLSRRRIEAESHWDKNAKLKDIRRQNNSEYLASYVKENLIDERYQEVFNDNRQFTAVRTLVPFLTARITAAEVVPSDGDDISIQFAHDFEDGLQKYAEKDNARAKIRSSVEDLLRGERVGIGKWRYDGLLKRVVYERIKPESVIIGSRSSQFEEPDYLCHTLKRSVGDLLNLFPDKTDEIKKHFGLVDGSETYNAQLEDIKKVREEWIWLDVNKEKVLCVGWSHAEFLFGKIKDPNWNENGQNVLESQMIPFVFFNFLNDGSGYIDQTSYIEQAKWNQSNYNKRGQTIAENAKYGGTGVPIFAKGSIQQKDVAKIRFSPVQRVLLDTENVNNAFTVWQSTPLPQYIVEDKMDLRESIDNIWGANATLRGQETGNDTLGQDVINRDQAEGRLSDPVDRIDESMTRFYLLEAQMFYRYFDEDHYIKYIGSDGTFVSIVVNQEKIAKNLGIQISVKAGTSLPVDRAQRRATVLKLLELNKISTIVAYKELDLFDDPEDAYKQFTLETVDPAASLEDVDKKVYSREAEEDLYTVIGGKVPEEREDIGDEYIQYLNDWLLTDKYMLLQAEDEEAAAKVSIFVDSVIAKASRKMNKMALQAVQPEVLNPPVTAPLDPNAQGSLPGEPPLQPPNPTPPVLPVA